jgi:hypothetical protein
MNWLVKLLSRTCLAGLIVLLGTVATQAAVPLLPVCSWPFESTGRGLTNVATPDTNATYSIMPFNTGHWRAMVVQGSYPEARFFNFDTYAATGSLVDSIVDSNIAPNPGGTNPFAAPAANGPYGYTLTVSAPPLGSPNFLRVGASGLAFIIS